MLIANHIAALREALPAWRNNGERIAFVPTLGNLHAGHIELVRQAKLHARRVVVCIFVNPTQFDRPDDFLAYPRTLEEDTRKLSEVGIDALFAPAAAELYPEAADNTVYIDAPGLSTLLEGAQRPGHFRGVATIVTKLFNIVQPDIALFGAKDYQQLLLIRRMVENLNMPVEIVSVATVRDADGLALSSRNSYLNEDERRRAPGLYLALRGAAEQIVSGTANYAAIERAGITRLSASGFRPDYFSVRQAGNLQLATPEDTDLILLAAAWLGKARLIDNLPLTLKPNA